MAEDWLKAYYGKQFDSFSPTVYMESSNFAIVRITDSKQMGFVLLRKGGKHNHSGQKSMGQGLPTSADIEKFKAALEAAEKSL